MTRRLAIKSSEGSLLSPEFEFGFNSSLFCAVERGNLGRPASLWFPSRRIINSSPSRAQRRRSQRASTPSQHLVRVEGYTGIGQRRVCQIELAPKILSAWWRLWPAAQLSHHIEPENLGPLLNYNITSQRWRPVGRGKFVESLQLGAFGLRPNFNELALKLPSPSVVWNGIEKFQRKMVRLLGPDLKGVETKSLVELKLSHHHHHFQFNFIHSRSSMCSHGWQAKFSLELAWPALGMGGLLAGSPGSLLWPSSARA